MRLNTVPIFALATTMAAVPAVAQFTQYTAPGSLAVQKVPTQELLKTAMEEARWDVGPLRLAPWLGIKNLTYYPDLYPEIPGNQSDVTASAGAGLTAYLPVGPRFVLAAQALPQYVWWKRYSNRREWNGQYGVGAFGYFRRLTLEVNALKSQDLAYVSAQNEVPTTVRQDRGNARLEIEILDRLYAYGSAGKTRWRYRASDLGGELGQQLVALDRDTTSTSGGLRYEWRKGFSVSLGVDHSAADFVHPESDLSNSGSAPAVGLDLEGAHFGISAHVARYSLKPKQGSHFMPFDGQTGDARLSWKLRDQLVWSVYGARQLSFAYGVGSTYYVDQRWGVSLQAPLGWHGSVRLFGERGENKYTSAAATPGQYNEDLRTYGATASLQLGRLAALTLGATREEYTSAAGGGSRSYTRFQTGLSFGGGAAALW